MTSLCTVTGDFRPQKGHVTSLNYMVNELFHPTQKLGRKASSCFGILSLDFSFFFFFFKSRRVYFSLGFEGPVHQDGEGMVTEQEAPQSGSKKRRVLILSSFFFFILSGSLVHGIAPPHSGHVFPLWLNPCGSILTVTPRGYAS